MITNVELTDGVIGTRTRSCEVDDRGVEDVYASWVRAVIETVSEVETSNTTCDAEYVKTSCPCCGEMKLLSQTFGPKINVITEAAFRDSFKLSSKTLSLLWVTGKKSFHVCNACCNLGAATVKIVIENHPQCE